MHKVSNASVTSVMHLPSSIYDAFVHIQLMHVYSVIQILTYVLWPDIACHSKKPSCYVVSR